MQGADGNRFLAAAALGIAKEALDDRLADNAQLRAIWSVQDKNSNAGGAPTLNERDAMLRNPLALQAAAAEPTKVELIDLVSKADYDLHRAKLGKLGLPKEVIDRIRQLEQLAPSTAHMIALSLEISHRDYHVTGLELTALLSDIFKQLMTKKDQPGFVASNEERAFLLKVYIEGVKERGNAFTRMLTGAQAMVQMAEGASSDGPTGKRRKPGFGALAVPEKKV